MGTLVADRIDRPLSLFDALEAPPAPARTPAREAPAGPGEADDSARDLATGEPHAADGGGADMLRSSAHAADTLEDASGAAHVHDGVGGEPTLDDLVVGAWEGLTAQAAVTCPLCDGGTLRPLYADAGGASPPVAGRCDSCGTTLS